MPQRRSPWRWLGLFWTVLLIVAAAGALTLQKLGPPEHHQVASVPATEHHQATAAPAHEPPEPHQAAIVPAAAPPSDPPPNTPRIAILIAGFGQSGKDSQAASDLLPGAVDFAVSAYAAAGPLTDAARAKGHELLASIPMEPEGYPLNDAGTRALMTGASPEDNRRNLDWALSRLAAAAGVTAASDGMRGERFAEVPGAFDPILDVIASRHLFYIDPRPGRSPARPGLAARSIDLIIDDPEGRADIEAKLLSLERIAREKGTALGLANTVRQASYERIAAWAQGLQAKGLTLVPVSALVPK